MFLAGVCSLLSPSVHQEATEREEEGRLLPQQEQSHAGLEEKQGDRGDAGDTGSPAPGDVVLAPPVDIADVQLQLHPASSAPSTGPAAGLTVPESGEGAVADAEPEAEEAPPCPLPRINPCLTVRGNTLYVYGGLLEVGEGEGEGGAGVRCLLLQRC